MPFVILLVFDQHNSWQAIDKNATLVAFFCFKSKHLGRFFAKVNGILGTNQDQLE